MAGQGRAQHGVRVAVKLMALALALVLVFWRRGGSRIHSLSSGSEKAAKISGMITRASREWVDAQG